MQNKHINCCLLVSILVVSCHQQLIMGRTIKGAKTKNITVESSQTLEKILVDNKSYENTTISTTTSTSTTPELETTTLPMNFEVDGRHAFINNQFVAEDEEPSSDSYNHLQHNSYINAEENFKDYEQESPKIKETIGINSDHVEMQNLPSRPILGYDSTHFDDYEDEDYNTENDYKPENCEDTQESLLDNNDEVAQNRLTQEQDIVDDDSANYEAQRKEHLGGLYDNNKTNKNPGLLYASRLVTNTQNIPNDHHAPAKPLQHYGLPPQTYSAYTQKPHYNIAKTPKPLLSYQNKQHTKPNNINPEHYISNNITSSLNLLSNLPNFSNDNSYMQTSSPFSSTSNHNNKKFKTVSTSMQYVSTPFGDLVFKYSIGMAKSSISKATNSSLEQQVGILKVRNNISGKTE